MFVLNNLCFVCLTDSGKNDLKIVFHKETTEEIFTHVSYALPEIMDLNADNPLYICSSCHITLRSFFLFKKKCLDNYSRWNDYIKVLQRCSDSPDQNSRQLQISGINSEPLVNHENAIYLKIEENEDSLLSQHEQETEAQNNIIIKEELLPYEGSALRDIHQPLVKIESVSEDEQDGGSTVTSDDNVLDNEETDFNADTASQEFHCSMCNEVFSDKFTFDTHLINHINNIKGSECLICNKKFRRLQHLKQHMKIHLGNKNFKCTFCNKKFPLKTNMNRHMKIHYGIKDYECLICKKKFTQRSHLNSHIKIHKGIKNYDCSICKKKFTENGHLKRHLKIHDGTRIKDYECTICKKQFLYNSSLKVHMLVHENIKK